MNTIFALPQGDWLSILPEIVLTGVGSIILLLEAFTPRLRPAFNGLALAGVAAAAAAPRRSSRPVSTSTA